MKTIIYITTIITLIVSSCGENKEIYEQTYNTKLQPALTQNKKHLIKKNSLI